MEKDVDNRQCRSCLYRATLVEHSKQTHNCEYILLVGKMRPSPPSPKCTAYERYNQRKRNALDRKRPGFN